MLFTQKGRRYRMEDTRVKIVKNPQLTNYLIEKGFNIIQVKASNKDRNKTVFVFKWSKELQKALDEYMNSKN